jgi:hypothetical protein
LRRLADGSKAQLMIAVDRPTSTLAKAKRFRLIAFLGGTTARNYAAFADLACGLNLDEIRPHDPTKLATTSLAPVALTIGTPSCRGPR